MTGYQYIYDTRGLLRNYNITDEDLLTDRQIEFWIMTQRATWIKRRDSAYTAVDHTLSQVVIDDVISIDRSFIPDAVPAGYKILRTNRRLPELINFTSWDGIISTGPIDMASTRFNHVEYREAIASGNGRFNRSQIYTYHLDGYLYLICKSIAIGWYLISKIGVVGIFANPRELGNFRHITGEACWSLNDEYPISVDLWEFMKDQIRKNNIDALYKVPVDQANDDNNSKKDMP
jgi:hypothetical protein